MILLDVTVQGEIVTTLVTDAADAESLDALGQLFQDEWGVAPDYSADGDEMFDIVVVPDDTPGDLVRSANDYVQALAVIPIDPEHDALVDRLVAERVAGTAKKRSLFDVVVVPDDAPEGIEP